jgi:hypothetical protein
MRLSLFSLLLLASHQVAEATPWRISSPMAVPRMPLVVGKDITARSLSSAASTTSLPIGSSNSGVRKGEGDSGELTDNEMLLPLSEDVARGGSTMIKPEQGESSLPADSNDTAPVTTPVADTVPVPTLVAHRSHVSKKRRKRKMEKLDGPHAMYAKKLKVRRNISLQYTASSPKPYIILTFSSCVLCPSFLES